MKQKQVCPNCQTSITEEDVFRDYQLDKIQCIPAFFSKKDKNFKALINEEMNNQIELNAGNNDLSSLTILSQVLNCIILF